MYTLPLGSHHTKITCESLCKLTCRFRLGLEGLHLIFLFFIGNGQFRRDMLADQWAPLLIM